MSNVDGEFPSLADTIAALRRELGLAQAAGQGQPLRVVADQFYGPAAL